MDAQASCRHQLVKSALVTKAPMLQAGHIMCSQDTQL